MAGVVPKNTDGGTLSEQIQGLDSRFWIVNTMEMFERLAYYGVRAVAALYIVLPMEQGGPEFTHIEKASIFAAWAAVQSLLPMFTGGFADRYGHKRTIAIAILIKIAGYLMMGHCKSYPLFFMGCMLLAAGTAIFKPGVQGTLAATLKKTNSSVGWGIFYQLVNIGGFLGPVLAGVLRMMDWIYVFYACALIVSVNFLWLPFYEDTTQDAQVDGEEDLTAQRESWASLSQAVSANLARGWVVAFGLTGAVWFASTFLGGALLAGGDPAWMGIGVVGVGLSLGAGFGARVPALAGRVWVAFVIALAGMIGLSWGGPLAGAQAALDGAAATSATADFVSSLSFVSWYLALAGFLLGGIMSWFAYRKAHYDAGRTDPGAVLVVSVAGLFQHRVFWFCMVFSGFWLMFNQVFDLLPNVIDDWVDSSGLIMAAGDLFSNPIAPIGFGLVGAVVFGGVCGVVVLLAMRPDQMPVSDVSRPAFAVVGVGLALAAMPVVAELNVLGAVAGAGFEGTPVPHISVLLLLCVVGLFGAVSARLSGLSARVIAGGAALVGAVSGFVSIHAALGAAAPVLVAMAEAGAQVPPEWMININPGLIVFTMVFVGYLSGRMRPLVSIIIGMVVATLGSVIAGTATIGMITLAGVAVFSVGEMLSSPKKMEYLGTLARKGQEGLFMGYANVPGAIGWIAGSIFAGNRYEEGGDKVNLARRHLSDVIGMAPDQVAALQKTQVMPTLARSLDVTQLEAQRILFETYQPQALWIDIGLIGVCSIVGMVVYDQVIRRIDAPRGENRGAGDGSAG